MNDNDLRKENIRLTAEVFVANTENQCWHDAIEAECNENVSNAPLLLKILREARRLFVERTGVAKS